MGNMSSYGADTETVQSQGRRVFNLEPDATSAVTGLLNSYEDAARKVHHPVVSGALSAYRDTHQKAHLTFPQAVRSLGSNTAEGGATIADGNNEAAAVQRGSLAEQEGLTRDINRPL